jgi:preprotein translocase subunit SecA
MNRQRQVIYEQRKKVLKGEDLWKDLEEMVEEVVEGIAPEYVDEKAHPEEWDLKGLDERILRHFTLRLNLSEKGRDLKPEDIVETIIKAVNAHLRNKEAEFGKPLMDYLMKVIMLQAIDTKWKENLLAMDHLREGIGLRGYGQKDPVR